jgi:5-methylcytosine-specific restriction protein A
MAQHPPPIPIYRNNYPFRTWGRADGMARQPIKAHAPRIATKDTRAVQPPPKTADPFYLQQAWRGLMKEIIARRGRRCEQCGRTHDGRGEAIRIFGDHIVELRDGGEPLDPRNVLLRCGSCHTNKTIAERVRRLRESATHGV